MLSAWRLTSFFGAHFNPGGPGRRALAAVTGDPDGVHAVGLQVLDQVCDGWDVHVLLVDQLFGLSLEVFTQMFGLEWWKGQRFVEEKNSENVTTLQSKA